MSKTKVIGGIAISMALALAAMNPAHASSRKTTNTIIGAGIGAAAGAVLTRGDTLATLGGAAAGGLLGNILTEEPRRHRPAARGGHRPHHHYVDHRHKPHHAYRHSHGKHKGKHKGRHHHRR